MRIREAWTEKKIAQLQKEGRGQGQGSAYNPWIKTRRALGSRGANHRYYGLKTGGREHHFLSDGEANFFFLLEWTPNVTDIREQYPFLDRGETLAIAAAAGLHHPCYPGTDIPCVITLDFLVNFSEGGQENLGAFSVKTASDLTDTNTLDTLELERRICASINARYRLVVSDTLDGNVMSNVRNMYQALPSSIESADMSHRIAMFCDRVMADLEQPKGDAMVAEYAREFDALHGLQPGFTLRVIWNLMWQRRIGYDLHAREMALLPVASLKVHPQTKPSLKVVGL